MNLGLLGEKQKCYHCAIQTHPNPQEYFIVRGHSLENDIDSFSSEDVVVLDAVLNRFPAFLDAQPELLHVRRESLKSSREVVGRLAVLIPLGAALFFTFSFVSFTSPLLTFHAKNVSQDVLPGAKLAHISSVWVKKSLHCCIAMCIQQSNSTFCHW